MKVQIEELEGKTAFAFCRHLNMPVDAQDESLEVYRGDTLSFTIPSIKRGSTLSLVERSNGGFRIEKYRKFNG